MGRSGGEELADGKGKAGEDVAAVQRVGVAEGEHLAARGVDGNGLSFGVDDPEEADAGGEPVVDFLLKVDAAVGGGEDFDGEVRWAVPEAFRDAGGGDAGFGDEGEIRGKDGVGVAGDEEAGFGAEVDRPSLCLLI